MSIGRGLIATRQKLILDTSTCGSFQPSLPALPLPSGHITLHAQV